MTDVIGPGTLSRGIVELALRGIGVLPGSRVTEDAEWFSVNVPLSRQGEFGARLIDQVESTTGGYRPLVVKMLLDAQVSVDQPGDRRGATIRFEGWRLW